MKMYQALAAIVFSAIALPTLAQMTPVGVWRSFDEKTNEPKSEVRITENAGVLQGTVQKVRGSVGPFGRTQTWLRVQ